MAFLDGGGSATLGVLSLSASGVTDAYAVALLSPENGVNAGATVAALRLLASSTGADLMDVQVQVASDVAFAALVWSTTLTDLGDGIATTTATGLADATEYWWRARVSAADASSWSEWTEVWHFRVDLMAGVANGYLDLNVGIDANEVVSTGNGYLDENVGIPITNVAIGNGYLDFNVGVHIQRCPDGTGYLAYGDVDSSTPTPLIWFLSPTSGRENDGIEVVGYGFGDLQSTYNGALEINMGGTIGWIPLNVTSWQTFPPTPDAYTEDRLLDPSTGDIDMQHQKIGMVVPVGAIPPGYPVRVVTDGA